ncbi:MAG: polysaccharide deacetylase family protein, partial [Gemmatimonadetes bacterium]|nr:polysaccharide deacetylase family protein [Gemmatimonadota bacterium]
MRGGLRRLRRSWQKTWPDASGVLLRRYPAFLFGEDAGAPDEIPVFTFHAVEPAWLARRLEHLAVNGYRTLTADELEGVLRARRPAAPRSVVLTFDDGHRSLYDIAFPLLREHGMRAVCFLVPGWIPGPETNAPGASGRRAEAEPPAFPAYPLCSWAEIREMHASGHVDFQSHSLHHNHVAVSSRVIDFVRAGAPTHPFADPPVATVRTPVQG